MKKTAKRKRGRPKKKHGKRDVRVVFMASKDEAERYQSAADDLQIDRSEWIRRVCDVAADEQLDE